MGVTNAQPNHFGTAIYDNYSQTLDFVPLARKGMVIIMKKAVITVIGKDTVGIIAKVSSLLYENDINILDISQTIMQDLFTMIMLVDMKDVQVGEIQKKLDKIAEEMKLSIRVQNEEIFNSMHRI